MTQKRSKPAPLGTVTGSGIAKLASFNSHITATSLREQYEIDIVGLITARSGVSAATVRAHCLAYGIGGAR